MLSLIIHLLLIMVMNFTTCYCIKKKKTKKDIHINIKTTEGQTGKEIDRQTDRQNRYISRYIETHALIRYYRERRD